MRFSDGRNGYSSPMKNRKVEIEEDRLHSRTTTENSMLKLKRHGSGLRKSIDIRMLLGGLLIVASFISAYVISQSTSRMVTVWSADVDLAPGEVIEESDISVSRVALVDKAEYYLDGGRSIVGTHVIRQVKASELIPAFAVAENPPTILKKVPISLNLLRIPDGITSGVVVDIYGVSRNAYAVAGQESEKAKSKLFLSDVVVDSINREASKLGGDIGLTLLVPPEEVARFIASIAEYDFILVRNT